MTRHVEPSLAKAQSDQKFLLEEFGYFVTDRGDHVAGKKQVFNRAKGLQDSWGKWPLYPTHISTIFETFEVGKK